MPSERVSKAEHARNLSVLRDLQSLQQGFAEQCRTLSGPEQMAHGHTRACLNKEQEQNKRKKSKQLKQDISSKTEHTTPTSASRYKTGTRGSAYSFACSGIHYMLWLQEITCQKAQLLSKPLPGCLDSARSQALCHRHLPPCHNADSASTQVDFLGKGCPRRCTWDVPHRLAACLRYLHQQTPSSILQKMHN